MGTVLVEQKFQVCTKESILKSYTFHSTDETRHITNHIDDNSRNVVYMVHCNRYHKQYKGETKGRLKERFNEQRRPVDKQTNSCKPTTV